MRSFTTSYKKISRVLSNEVIITKAVSPSNSKHLSLKEYNHKKYSSIWDTGQQEVLSLKRLYRSLI